MSLLNRFLWYFWHLFYRLILILMLLLYRTDQFNISVITRPRYIGGRGIVFDRFVFLCFFVSKITRNRLK